MYWLISLVMAGVLFSSDSSLPVSSNYGFAESNNVKNVKFDETERFDQTYQLNPNGKVSVSNINGSITIETWDNPQVRLEAVKTADTKERLSEVEIKIEARQDFFSVETDYDNWKRDGKGWKNHGKLQVEFKLTVPRGALLDEIETVNGSITISNTTNSTKASAVNGEVRAMNLRGTANLSTVNGTLEADFDQLQTGSRISLNTVNGTVNLMIPSDASATVRADTVNGSINNDFGLPVRKGKYVGKDLYGKIGSGDVQIKLNSVNGGLSVRRKNDGKNINPATNLLNMKNEDDEDWDDEDDDTDSSKIKPPKPPKPHKAPKPYNAPKPPKPPVPGEFDNEAINDAIEEGMREAEREIEKLNPNLEKLNRDALKQAENELKRINSEEFREKIKEAQEKQKALFNRMKDGNWLVGSPNIEKKSGSFTVKGVPKVTVEAKKCTVTVRGWDKAEVGYSIVKMSRRNQKPLAADSSISVKNTDSEVNIKVLSETDSAEGGFFGELNRVRLEIFVPEKSNLKITTDGEIRLEGVSGEIELNGADGAMDIRDSDGKLRLTTVDGRIRVIGFKGEVYAQTTDGDLNLEGDFQKLFANTTDGAIILTLPENTNANLAANKEITGGGLVLTREKANNWRVGSGGVQYLLHSADGQIIIRTLNALKAN